MKNPTRLVLSAAAALIVTGCTASPGEQGPTSSAEPDDTGSTSTPADGDDFEAAWLDDGRMFAIVTWGSSTCIPFVDEVSAEGQNVTVALTLSSDQQACTADFAPRASVGALPEGVDPTKDVEFLVTLDEITDDVDLDGNPALTGVPGEATDYEPSAGWFDDAGIVLLTWGSSGCPPVVESIDTQATGATVNFKTEDRACTMDMAPRATLIGLEGEVDDDADYTLTLVGDDLDATVDVLRG
ncbi:hypothetical protein [Microbacterium paludicola]|uniref:hypothetical protein n=1 Tax=Microbacterium paludicola TaxID=300019 RepID=UPI0011A73694|nr:hypothetical protein [Microbacterium paludicola]